MRKNSAYAKTYDGLDIIYDDGVHWFTKIKIFFKVDYKILKKYVPGTFSKWQIRRIAFWFLFYRKKYYIFDEFRRLGCTYDFCYDQAKHNKPMTKPKTKQEIREDKLKRVLKIK